MSELGFYVTLPCNASTSIYPENCISNYRTRLARSIILKGLWEVALVEFEYPLTWYAFNEDDAFFVIVCDQCLLQDNHELPDVRGDAFQKPLKLSTSRYTLKCGYFEDVPILLRDINISLPPAVRLVYDRIKNKVFLKAPHGTSLTFYGKLAIILGLKPGVSIEAVNSSDEHRDTHITYAPFQADINGGFYTLYVYTDIIECQTVGDVHVPLLGTIHIEGETNKVVSVRYDKSHYVRLNKNSINEITIEIKDDLNRDVPFTYGKVVSKLHFRPVKQHLF
jgi:hypothetical protein